MRIRQEEVGPCLQDVQHHDLVALQAQLHADVLAIANQEGGADRGWQRPQFSVHPGHCLPHLVQQLLCLLWKYAAQH